MSRRGHQITVYSPILGDIARELGEHGIPIVDDVRNTAMEPDLIHGHHHIPTLEALLWFPRAPAVFVCRDPLAWHDAPPRHPRVRRFVGIDTWCSERLRRESGASSRTSMIRHGFDLESLQVREPLPKRPKRGLIYSNQAWPGGWAQEILRACAALSLEAEIVGLANGNPTDRPELLLAKYDVVFAKGRSAFEAAAVGAFVIACDAVGLGPALTGQTVSECWEGNCGFKLLSAPVTETNVRQRLSDYDPSEARAVQEFVRFHGRMDLALEKWESVYHDVAGAERDYSEEAEAAAYLRGFGLLRDAERAEAISRWAAERKIESFSSQAASGQAAES